MPWLQLHVLSKALEPISDIKIDFLHSVWDQTEETDTLFHTNLGEN